MAGDIRYEALYTTHKTQKRKVWHDGKVRVTAKGFLQLLDDSGKFLDTIPGNKKVEPDVELEIGQYLVQIESKIEEVESRKIANVNECTETDAKHAVQSEMRKNSGPELVQAQKSVQLSTPKMRPMYARLKPLVSNLKRIESKASKSKAEKWRNGIVREDPPENGRSLTQILQLLDDSQN